jgi:hypothetical protein
VEKGDLYVVLQTDLRANTVTVEDVRQGMALTLPLRQDAKLAASLVLYVPEERNFAMGERVRFTIADKDRNIVNGTRGVIQAIGDDSITVSVAGRDPVMLPLASVTARGLDHAYAATVHDFQGSTVNRIIVGLSSSEQLATQKSFYVAISRMREDALLVTDDAAAMARRLEANTGDRPTALESWIRAERERHEKQKTEAPVPQEKTASPDRSERERDVQGPKPSIDQDRPDRAADYAKFFSLPVERTDAEVAQTLKALAERQKQKTIEGPIR